VSATPSLDIVVVTSNTRSLTLRCAAAVLAPRRGPRLHLIVVDNGSSDGTADAILERWPEATVLRNEEDVGFASACNQGARAGEGDHILFLNSDAFPRHGAVERLVSFLEAHPKHSAAAGLLVDVGTERPQVGFAVRGFPTLATQVALLLGLERLWPGNPVSRRQTVPDFDYGATQDLAAQPAGACLACRRASFEVAGGFDEAFYYWFEDVDLVLRLQQVGPIAFVHDAVFDHVGGGTFSGWNRPQVVRARYASLLYFFAKHHSLRDQIGLRLVVGVLATARLLPLGVGAPERARAYRDVLRMAVTGLRGPRRNGA
jgi:N-acetylglucosaminyl-diphospho-decaprenol L-rhamnosyltransferase